MTEPGREPRKIQTLIVCVNGNEARDLREEDCIPARLGQADARSWCLIRVASASCGPGCRVRERDYADPLSGVEENIAYNAFLVGKSLLGMRVTDVIAGFQKLHARWRPERFVVCGRRDAAVVALLAAAVEPLITHVAVEEMLLSFRSLFSAQGTPITPPAFYRGCSSNSATCPRSWLKSTCARSSLRPAKARSQRRARRSGRSHPDSATAPMDSTLWLRE